MPSAVEHATGKEESKRHETIVLSSGEGVAEKGGQELILGKFEVTPFFSNCFILGCEQAREGVVIDAGEFTHEIEQFLEAEKLSVKSIILTHSHVDHAGDISRFKEKTGGEIVLHVDEEALYLNMATQARMFGFDLPAPPPPDRLVRDGDEITFGAGHTLKIIHCPGHSPGGISICSEAGVFVGDTLFAGSIGRTDLPGGDYRTLINSIKTGLLPLGDNLPVYPGHGPATSMATERKYNPFLA